MSKLYLRFFENDDNTVEWLMLNEKNEITHTCQQNKFAELPAISADTFIIVLVPTVHVWLTEVQLPPTKRARLQQAIPYALEDQLTVDLEQLHFVIGERKEGKIPVAVVEQQQMQQWLSILQNHGLNADVMLPDVLALPYQKNFWSCAIEKNTALIRNGLQLGSSVDKNNIVTFLQRLLNEAQENLPQQLIIENYAQANSAEFESLNKSLSIEINDHPEPLLVLATKIALSMNLLQGKYQVKSKNKKIKPQWRYVKYLAIFWLFIIIFGSLAEYFYLKIQVASLQQKINSLYQQIFPDETANDDSDIKRRLGHELQGLRAAANGDEFLSLVGKVGSVLHAHPSITIQQLNFQNHELSLLLVLNNFSDLAEVVQEIKSQGLPVNQDNVTGQGKRVSAHLTIGGNH